MKITTHYFYAGDESAFVQWIEQQSYSAVFVLTDANVEGACLDIFSSFLPDLQFSTIVVQAGEAHKNMETLSLIWQQMQAADRHALLINLGGGVISDMGGLAASLFKRGISFIHIPTTLLAMADATSGGKTAVNFQQFKNHIGLFAQPEAVYVNTTFLQSLSEAHIRAGMAEILKLGIIYDEKLLQAYDAWDGNWNISLDWIKQSIEAKMRIVEQDPLEKGLRKLLNFGHTLGHALESMSMSSTIPLLHGEAVALGMQGEAHIALERKMISSQDFDRIIHWTNRLCPGYSWAEFDGSAFWKYLSGDKKNKNAQISFSLPTAIGMGAFDVFCTKEEIENGLQYILQK